MSEISCVQVVTEDRHLTGCGEKCIVRIDGKKGSGNQSYCKSFNPRCPARDSTRGVGTLAVPFLKLKRDHSGPSLVSIFPREHLSNRKITRGRGRARIGQRPKTSKTTGKKGHQADRYKKTVSFEKKFPFEKSFGLISGRSDRGSSFCDTEKVIGELTSSHWLGKGLPLSLSVKSKRNVNFRIRVSGQLKRSRKNKFRKATVFLIEQKVDHDSCTKRDNAIMRGEKVSVGEGFRNFSNQSGLRDRLSVRRDAQRKD